MHEWHISSKRALALYNEMTNRIASRSSKLNYPCCGRCSSGGIYLEIVPPPYSDLIGSEGGFGGEHAKLQNSSGPIAGVRAPHDMQHAHLCSNTEQDQLAKSVYLQGVAAVERVSRLIQGVAGDGVGAMAMAEPHYPMCQPTRLPQVVPLMCLGLSACRRLH